MSDNKKYVGKIDRIRVALGEDYEVDYFVDDYIRERGYTPTPDNRRTMHEYLDDYPHSGTVMREHLTAWLNQKIPKGWVYSAIPSKWQ